MDSPVQKIKERMPIDELISSYIKIEKSGANFKARCPFHNEKTPSFFISPDRGSYYCFGCAAKGDIFTFVEEFEGLDFRGTLKLLAERTGVELEHYNPKDQENQSEKEKLYSVMEASTKFFEENLSKNTDVLEYLKNRGLEEKTIKDFRIGYVKNDWRELYTFLTGKSFSEKDIELAGLGKKTEKGMYDRFRGRVMFPIADSSGRIIAFSGRLFEDDGKSAKYLNSPDTPIFNKSSVLYGIDKAKESIRRNNFSILVEGQMDLVLSHQAGFKNTVAGSGTALSDSLVSKENVVSNLGILRRLSGNMVLAYDADKAGINASNRAGKIALSLGMDVKSASMPEGMDPADLISKVGVEAWKEAIRNSKHIIVFLLEKIIKSAEGDERKINKEVKEKILPYISALDGAIEKSHFIKKVSDLSNIPENALIEDLKSFEKNAKEEHFQIKEVIHNQVAVFRKDYIEKRLMGIIFWQMQSVVKKIDVDKTLKELGEVLNKNTEEILEKWKIMQPDLLFEAEVFYGQVENLEDDVGEMIANLYEEYLNENFSKKMRELQLIQDKKDKDAKDTDNEIKILTEIDELVKKREIIKSGRYNKNRI
ncbi:MAG: DNA primase [Patescibacteria group bacterium]